MRDARKEYETALAAFAAPGGRWANKGALTYWGRAAGLSAEGIIADARAAGVTDRDADIRRGWNDARPKGDAPQASYTPRAKVQAPPKYPRFVRSMLDGIDTTKGTIDWVRELSPSLDWLGKPPHEQTAAFFRAAFRPDERLFVFKKIVLRDGTETATKGVPGVSIVSAEEWARRAKNGMNLGGECVVPNPLTGELGKTNEGKPSFVAQSCIVSFPFLILEFDEMPLPMQFAFWRSFILTSKLTSRLVSITFSGGKSLHGLLHLGCKTLLEWQAARNRIAGFFAADPDPVYRADPQAMNPRQGVRIPGIVRSNGKLQELVYLNPAAREGTMETETGNAPCV